MRIIANFFSDGMKLTAVGHDHRHDGQLVVRVDGIFTNQGAEVERLSSDVVFEAERALDAAFLSDVWLSGEKEVS